MKKKSRRPRSSEASRRTGRTQTAVSVSEEKRPPGNRGRPRKTVPVTAGGLYHDDAAKDETAHLDFSVTAADDTQRHPESKSRSSGEGLSGSHNALSLVSCQDRKPHQTPFKKLALYSCLFQTV